MLQLEQKLTTEAAARALSPQATPNLPSWILSVHNRSKPRIAPPIVNGRVSALAVDPGNANIVYLGGAQGGVWKTTNGGTWHFRNFGVAERGACATFSHVD